MTVYSNDVTLIIGEIQKIFPASVRDSLINNIDYSISLLMHVVEVYVEQHENIIETLLISDPDSFS